MACASKQLNGFRGEDCSCSEQTEREEAPPNLYILVSKLYLSIVKRHMLSLRLTRWVEFCEASNRAMSAIEVAAAQRLINIYKSALLHSLIK
jgi:hypothetical protein